jgi:AcrR family transcriptional regulator
MNNVHELARIHSRFPRQPPAADHQSGTLIMGRRNEHTREQQRTMALAAAADLVDREGQAGISMRAVGRAIGYTAGNLYLLFANQDDLLATVSEGTADAMYAALAGAAARCREPLAKLQAIAAAYIRFAQQHPNRWRLLFEHRLPPGTPDRPGAIVRQAALFDLVKAHLRPLLPNLQERQLHAAATALWSSVHGLCVLAVTGKLGWSGISSTRQLSDLIVHALVVGLNRP